MIFTDISHARFEGADCVVGIVAGVDICDLSVIIIQSLSKNYETFCPFESVKIGFWYIKVINI